MATKKTAAPAKKEANEEYVWCTSDDGYVSDEFSSVDACFKDAQRSVEHLAKEEEVLIYKLVAKARATTKLEIVE